MTHDILSKALQLLKMSDVHQISEIYPKQNGHVVVISYDSEPYVLSVQEAEYVMLKVEPPKQNNFNPPRFKGMNLN